MLDVTPDRNAFELAEVRLPPHRRRA